MFSPKKGESIEILYLKSDPKVSVIDSFWQKYLGPLLSLGVGLLFLWFASVEFKGLSKNDA